MSSRILLLAKALETATPQQLIRVRARLERKYDDCNEYTPMYEREITEAIRAIDRQQYDHPMISQRLDHKDIEKIFGDI